jgi:hypothetical protein
MRQQSPHERRKKCIFARGAVGVVMDRDELEALMAIYGDELAHVQEDGTLAVVARSSDESKEAVLLMTAGAGYPAELPRLSVTVNRGVKNEVLLAIVKLLEREAAELQGMPMAFALAEKLKQLLDESDVVAGSSGSGGGGESSASKAKAAEAEEAAARPLNHQVGEPLITTGTRCTENVFQEWREKWLEKRAATLAERARQREQEADGRPTGKQMFEAARDDDKAARQLLQQLIADENVDESLFK